MDFYRTLGLTHTADANAIRVAYRALAKRYHPDVSTLPDAHDRFISITEAYEVLSDPAARARYDRTRQSPSPKHSSPGTEARYTRSTEARQRAARTKAEEYSRMRYEQFDEYAFDTVAGYIAPKMLGCLGIGVLGMVAFGLIMLAVHDIDWIAIPLAILAVTGLLPGMVYLSTRFDEWHNRKQVDKKRGRR